MNGVIDDIMNVAAWFSLESLSEATIGGVL